jgi:hypothetical protein
VRLDLERGYTSVRLHRGGIAAGRQRVREIPEGGPHAVVRGEREALFGVMVREQPRLQWPPGSMETPCPRCEEELQKLADAGTSADS